MTNGGFDQYFFNSSRCYAEHAAAGLRLLGARVHLDLLSQATTAVQTAVTPRGLSFRDPRWRQAYADAGDIAALETLTRRYWESPSLNPAHTEYISLHLGQFLTD